MGTADVTHDELVERAVRWLRGTGKCTLTVINSHPWDCEAPDAIGWRPGGISVLIECKVSVEDYYADRRKPWRRFPTNGMGVFRYFMTPKDLLAGLYLNDWGLLEAGAKIVRKLKDAEAQIHNPMAEIKLLMSAIRTKRTSCDQLPNKGP